MGARFNALTNGARLTKESSRRGNWGRVSQRIKGSIGQANLIKMRWRREGESAWRIRKLELPQLQGKLGFLLGLFAFGNPFAERTWMLAIERPLDRFGQRTGAKILCQHVCPRNGLENDPMRPNRAKQREDCKGMTKSFEHP